MKYLRLTGAAARPYAEQLASLRMKVFREFPYLYQGNFNYEMNYLETYFKSDYSFLFLIKRDETIIGATTGILASEEEESFRSPFIKHGLQPSSVFYFGESVLLPEYRGKGFGKLFFKEREDFASQIDEVTTLSFCAVERSSHHPLRPHDYRPLHTFWESMGFHLEPGLTTYYKWKDINEDVETNKKMQFWIKSLGGRKS